VTVKTNLIVNQGADFSNTISITVSNGDVWNLTDYTGEAQLRKHYSSNSYHTLTVNIAESNGAITLSLTAVQTANIDQGRYFYDCLVTSSENAVYCVIEGVITVLPGITR